ncbi:MAG: HPF/RaiA family ribosome-associated protein [Saprospiraceae bacterium]
MKIQFNTDKTIHGDEMLQHHFTSLIALIVEELKRFQSHITGIEVHLSDENGGNEGLNEMLCLLEARIEGRRPIAVSYQDITVELAVSGAIDKLKTSLGSTLSKLQNHEPSNRNYRNNIP